MNAPRERGTADEEPGGPARVESGPRLAVEIFSAEFHLEQEEGGWVVYFAPDDLERAESREAAIRKAHARLLRAAATHIEKGDLNPPESFALSVRLR